MALHKHITLLPGNVAQRIAAGEVIDRPNAVLRELLDNAIDAGADTIDVHIQKGGIDSIRVIDNGNGMSKEDLELCCKSHATSKISNISDLDELNTLGFRGEALNSISVSSELKIITKVDAENCYTLETAHGDEEQIYPGGSAKGSTVEVKNLFHAIPARKKFLKSPQGEAAACKKTCIEKALPFPEIQFRFYSNGAMKFFLPVSSQLERVQNAYSHLIEKNFLKKMEVSAGNFSFTAILSSPSLHRTDRSYIQVFINNRKIQEYSLVQAVTYGYDSFLPGGTFPYCFLFVNVQSDLVDFNIHPAKREVKLRNLREIHHQIVVEIKKFLAENSNSKPSFLSYNTSHSENELQNPEFEGIGNFPNRTHDREPMYKEPGSSQTANKNSSNFHSHSQQSSSFSYAANRLANPKQEETLNQYRKSWAETVDAARITAENDKNFTQPSKNHLPEAADDETYEYEFNYLGQLFNLFLLVEKGSNLYIIDQHAAHERIIYEELKKRPERQKLLIPLSFTVDPDVDEFLQEHKNIYEQISISITRLEEGTWEMTELPSLCQGLEHELIDFIYNSSGNVQEIEKQLYASISCKAAVKDGDSLDELSAKQLIQKVFLLPEPRCPHGRPVWHTVSREELFQKVQRIV